MIRIVMSGDKKKDSASSSTKSDSSQSMSDEDFRKTLTKEQLEILDRRNEASKDRPMFRSKGFACINSYPQKDSKK